MPDGRQAGQGVLAYGQLPAFRELLFGVGTEEEGRQSTQIPRPGGFAILSCENRRLIARIVEVSPSDILVEHFKLLRTDIYLQEDRIGNPKILRSEAMRLPKAQVVSERLLDVYDECDQGQCGLSHETQTWVHSKHPIYVINRFKFGELWWMKRGGLFGLR